MTTQTAKKRAKTKNARDTAYQKRKIMRGKNNTDRQIRYKRRKRTGENDRNPGTH